MKRLRVASISKPNLSALYKSFNRKYFKGDLPELPMYWAKTKKYLGAVEATFRRTDKGRELVEESLKFIMAEDSLEGTEEDFQGIFLHEMIHVWMYTASGLTGDEVLNDGDLSDGHGPKFMKKLKEVSKKSGIDIPVSEAYTQDWMLKDDDEKMYAFLFGHEGDKVNILVFTEEEYTKNERKYKKEAEKFFEKDDVLSYLIIHSNHPLVYKYRQVGKLEGTMQSMLFPMWDIMPILDRSKTDIILNKRK